MAFEEGNKLAAKGRKVEKMLERICLQEDDRRLREGLEVVMDLVSKGDKWAIEFTTDRLDGKPKQTVGADPDNPFPDVHRVELVALK